MIFTFSEMKYVALFKLAPHAFNPNPDTQGFIFTHMTDWLQIPQYI